MRSPHASPHAFAAVVLGIVVLGGGRAHAQEKGVSYSYEVENLEAVPEKVFVAWPRNCGSTGDPLGTVSLQLNPDWVSRLHEVDYEVLEKGKRHAVSPYCLATMRIHALPAAAFPRSSRVATADDTALGVKPGESLAILPALDEIDLPKRIPFFASDPRQISSPFRFDAPGPRPTDSFTAVHHVLAVDPATFTVRSKRATYTYADRPPETIDTAAAADAGADAGSAVVTPTPAAPPPDRGTRWVYAAAVLGLIAGGVIAHYRKKRAADAGK